MVTENSSLFWPLEKYYDHVCVVQSVFKQEGEESALYYIICVLEDEIKFANKRAS